MLSRSRNHTTEAVAASFAKFQPMSPFYDSEKHPPVRLRRTLSLRDLLIYGMVIVSPMSPMPTFGLLSERGGGHVVTAILLACIAMLFTSISYGRMAQMYPSAGSSFTYVAKELHPSLGYIVGWAILMDYVLTALICVIWCAEQAHDFLPLIPVLAWKALFVGSYIVLNVQGIRTSARVNTGLAASMGLVVIVFLVAAMHYLVVHPLAYATLYRRPFYDPQTFTFGRLLGCTAIAVMSYLGFDCISTLSEEAKNPRRNIMLATVLTCVITGVIAAIEVYIAQLIWPASEPFPHVDTAYVWVAGRVWPPLFGLLGFILLIGTLGSGLVAHLGSARLLYAMGRSKALPAGFFGSLDPAHRIPRNNVLAVGVVLLFAMSVLDFGVVAQTVNFGALLAFMGVNAAAFVRFFVRAERRTIVNFVPPVLGFVICLTLWWNISAPATMVGSTWMVVGIALALWRTRGFRLPLSLELPAE
jgi:putrescine importer